MTDEPALAPSPDGSHETTPSNHGRQAWWTFWRRRPILTVLGATTALAIAAAVTVNVARGHDQADSPTCTDSTGTCHATAPRTPASPVPVTMTHTFDTGQDPSEGSVNRVAFSPDGKTIATANRYGPAQIWDIATGTEIHALNTSDPYHPTFSTNSVAFSPDGRYLATGEPHEARIWDVATGTEIRALRGGFVANTAFSPDGKILAVATQRNRDEGRTNVISLWDVATGDVVRTLEAPAGDPGRPEDPGHFENPRGLAFSPDGNTLATNTGDNGTAQLWEVSTGALLRTYPSEHVVDVTFAPDGKTIAANTVDDGTFLWDVATDDGATVPPVRTIAGLSVKFSPDGKTLAAAEAMHVALIDLSTHKLILFFTANPDPDPGPGPGEGFLRDVVFSPDGKTLATCGRSPLVHLWKISEETE